MYQALEFQFVIMRANENRTTLNPLLEAQWVLVQFQQNGVR